MHRLICAERIWLISLVLVLVVGFVPLPEAEAAPPVSPSPQDVVVTIALPQFQAQFFEDAIEEFEAHNPGVEVQIIENEAVALTDARADIDEHLSQALEYASSADVVHINQNKLSLEMTRAGLLLDLMPLVTVDATLNIDDFYPAAWQSLQWDGAIWGIPATATPLMIDYDIAAFDAAGLPYPNENWTLEDYAFAAEQLASVDENGNPVPGLAVSPEGFQALMLALSGQRLYDESASPNAPSLVNEELVTLLERWAELEANGDVAVGGGFFINAPLAIGSMGRRGTFSINSEGEVVQGSPQGVAMLPNGASSLTVEGFAVSAGTQYPELAYQLAKHLTSDAGAVNAFFNSNPARQSLAGAQSGGQIFRAGQGAASPEEQALIDQALSSGIPYSELRYADFLQTILNKMQDEGLDALTAMQETEDEALLAFQTVADFAAETTVFVEPPRMGRPLAPGEIALQFGVSGITIANEQAWEDVIDTFAASDSDVGDVILDTPDFSENNLGSMAQNYDCFYFSSNQVPSADLSLLLSLDPFIDADFDFDRSDVLGDILAQVQRDNRTWAFPLNIEPQVLWYNPQVFMQSGVLEPTDGWTADMFEDVLRQLQTEAEVAAFTNNSFSNEYILMLMAAYGALPIDFRTNPPTLHFTDPSAVAAIQRVLDLAREGYINYEALFNPNNRVRFFSIDSDIDEPIYSDSLSGLLAGFNVRGFDGASGPANFDQAGETTEATHVPATYPQGSQYVPVSYSIGTGYISATAQNPEACYRWLSTIAQHQELFTRMPAQQSLIEDPNLTAMLGEATVNFYRAYSQVLLQPNVVEFPTTTTGVAVSENIFYMNWLFRAFDRYVLEGADLERELEEAQFYAEAFRGCAEQLEPPEPGTVAQIDYFQSLNECAVIADPSLSG